MKTINWTKIPVSAITTSNAEQQPNIWQLIGQKFVKESGSVPSAPEREDPMQQLVDFDQLEELFCLSSASNLSGANINGTSGAGNVQQLTPATAISCPNSPQIGRRASSALVTGSEPSSDSSLSLDYVSANQLQEHGDSASLGTEHCSPLTRLQAEPVVAILDSKRTLSVNIFLKQYRGTSLEDIVDFIRRDKHSDIGLEKLRSLQSLLPSESEIGLLRQHSSE